MFPRPIVIALALGALACSADRASERASQPSFVERMRSETPAAAPLLDRARESPVRGDASKWTIRLKSVSAELPLTADRPFEITGGSAFRAQVRWLGATTAPGVIDSGAVVYRNALPGVDGVVFGAGESVEELIRLESPTKRFAYRIDLPTGATLSSVSRTLVELRDAEGRARIRLRAARAWDAAGNVLEPSLAISGNTVELGVESANPGPVLIDPAWEPTSALSVLREHGSATLLPSGRVLLAGGLAPVIGYLQNAEIYDPASGTFTATGNIQATRIYHTATLLPSGKVLISGGVSPAGGLHDSAELYDEQTGKFTTVGKMAVGRSDHTSVLLDSGKVFLIGGNALTSVLASSELFDPATSTFTAGATLGTARYGHTTTRMPNGKLLVAGGYGGSGAIIASTELYDPSTNAFTPSAPMAAQRTRHTAVLTPAGKVLIMGGTGPAGTLGTNEVFDSTSQTFSPGGSLLEKRSWFSATLLPSGAIVIAGGETAGVGLATAELFDPVTLSSSPTQAMAAQRLHHTATMLPSGKVLVGGGPFSTVVDLFDPFSSTPGSVATTNPIAAAKKLGTATLLPSGKVLIAGGESNGVPSATADVFDPANGSVTPTASMSKPRSQHTATLLRSGKVLLLGGASTGATVLADAELFDPAANGGVGAFTPAGAMGTPREIHSATLLHTGEVLITGGVTSGFGILASAELYDPSANAGAGGFSPCNPMTAKHFGHTATLLRQGKVLVAAGITGNLVAEVYDRTTNSFTAVGNLTRGRFRHTATLLPSGKVLIAGGVDGSTILSSTELFDPTTGGFVQTGSMADPRSGFTATMLPSGRVLVGGGEGVSGALASLELYDPGDGNFSAAGALLGARSDLVSQLLPDGRVLFAGGAAANVALSSTEVWRDGFVGNSSWRPVLTSAPASIVSGQSAGITGAELRGISSASFGNTQSSDTNYPIAVWLPAVGGWGTVGRLTGFSATAATWTPPPTVLSGYGFLFVVTNGIASSARMTSILPAPTAAPCTVDGECALGHCVDNVCCDTPCSLPCQACSAALKGGGVDGVCGSVEIDTDPKNGCAIEPQVTCGTTGNCDGAGACARYKVGSVCFAASCSGVVFSPAFTCDGKGGCQPSQPLNCTPGVCKGSGTGAACVTVCAKDTDCAPGSFCKDQQCAAPEEPGVPCTSASQCLTGYCVDGFCCNSKCSDTCAACSKQKSGAPDGICAPIANETDPDEECSPEPPASCGRDGMCNGAFACRLYSNDTECGQSSCEDLVDESKQQQSYCDGSGVCSDPISISCGNYSCGDDGKCNTGCSDDDDCSPLYRCNLSGQCVPRGESICIGEAISESPDGTKEDCRFYRCNPSSGLCRTICGSTADCRSGYECGGNGRCREPFPSPDPGCGCRAVGGGRSAPAAWWLFALGLVLWRARSAPDCPRARTRRDSAHA